MGDRLCISMHRENKTRMEMSMENIVASPTVNPVKPKRPPVAQRGLRVPDVAAELGVSERFLWSKISAGELEVIRIGQRCTRVLRPSLERFIDANRG